MCVNEHVNHWAETKEKRRCSLLLAFNNTLTAWERVNQMMSLTIRVETYASLGVLVFAQQDCSLLLLHNEVAVVATSTVSELSVLDGKELSVGDAFETHNWAVSVLFLGATHTEASVGSETAVGSHIATVSEADGFGRGFVHNEHSFAAEVSKRTQRLLLDSGGEDELSHAWTDVIKPEGVKAIG